MTFKTIRLFLTNERLAGLGVLLATLFVSSIANVPTAAWTISGIILSAYFGGLRVGLLAGVISSVWTYFYLDYDTSRFLQVSVNLIFMGGLVGWLKNRQRLGDGAIKRIDTNIIKLKRIGNTCNDLLQNWNHLSDDQKYENIRIIREHVTQLMTLTAGWRDLWLAKEEVLAERDERDYVTRPIEQ